MTPRLESKPKIWSSRIVLRLTSPSPWRFVSRSDWYHAKPKLPWKSGLGVPSDSCGVFSTVKTSKPRLGLRPFTLRVSRSFSSPRCTLTVAVGTWPGAAKQFSCAALGNSENVVSEGLDVAALAAIEPPATAAATAVAAARRRAREVNRLMEGSFAQNNDPMPITESWGGTSAPVERFAACRRG